MCLTLNQFAQFRVPSLTISLKQQQFALIVIIIYTSSAYINNNSAIGLYNRDLQTAIILFTRNVSSHKTDRILYALPLLAPSCLLYRRVNSMMNALEGECLCFSEISKNVTNLLAVLRLILSPFFTLMLLLYAHLFVDYVNKSIIFVFWAFVYNFKNIVCR